MILQDTTAWMMVSRSIPSIQGQRLWEPIMFLQDSHWVKIYWLGSWTFIAFTYNCPNYKQLDCNIHWTSRLQECFLVTCVNCGMDVCQRTLEAELLLSMCSWFALLVVVLFLNVLVPASWLAKNSLCFAFYRRKHIVAVLAVRGTRYNKRRSMAADMNSPSEELERNRALFAEINLPDTTQCF